LSKPEVNFISRVLNPGPLDLDSESERLPRTIKLTSVSDFQRVFKQGNFKSQDKGFVVLALKNDLGNGRLGITVGKKNVSSAVARNRIKRLIRESFRHNKKNVRGLDLVVIVRRGTDKLTNNNINVALEKHWQHLAMLVQNRK